MSAELNQKQITEIDRLNKMRQDFVANVSHELRTPLTVIHGYVETLLNLYVDDVKLSDIFTNMQQQTMRMETLIEELLLLAKIENESPEAVFEPINPMKIFSLIKKDMEHLGKNHQMIWRLDPSFEILGDAGELRSVFSNLITNAIRYTKAGGRVLIETGPGYFKVQDSGIGIAPENISRITERFYRVDKGRSRDSGGTGLGLAIVKHVLLRHQAELRIDSLLGIGSTFTCWFPQNRQK